MGTELLTAPEPRETEEGAAMTEIITAKHTSERGHWYRKDGTPAYEIIGKNGLPRPTTLRDARKEGLLPSVTSIIRLAAAPGLDIWKQDQTILACLTMPKIHAESEADYVARIKSDAKEQARQAAERGTLIHAYVQEGFSSVPYTKLAEEGRRYYESARDTLVAECNLVEWVCEQSFARDGYGGKVDLHCPEILVDVKPTEKDLDTVNTWDEQSQQCAAYRHGLWLNNARCAILYINVITAASRLMWVSEEELKQGFNCFMALLKYWHAKNQIEEGL